MVGEKIATKSAHAQNFNSKFPPNFAHAPISSVGQIIVYGQISVLCRAIELAVLTSFAVMIVFAYGFVLLPVALHIVHILKIGFRAGKFVLLLDTYYSQLHQIRPLQ